MTVNKCMVLLYVASFFAIIVSSGCTKDTKRQVSDNERDNNVFASKKEGLLKHGAEGQWTRPIVSLNHPTRNKPSSQFLGSLENTFAKPAEESKKLHTSKKYNLVNHYLPHSHHNPVPLTISNDLKPRINKYLNPLKNTKDTAEVNDKKPHDKLHFLKGIKGPPIRQLVYSPVPLHANSESDSKTSGVSWKNNIHSLNYIEGIPSEQVVRQNLPKVLPVAPPNKPDYSRLIQILNHYSDSLENIGKLSSEYNRTREKKILKDDKLLNHIELSRKQNEQMDYIPGPSLDTSQTLAEAWKEYVESSEENSGTLSAELAEIERLNLMKALSSENVLKHYEQHKLNHNDVQHEYPLKSSLTNNVTKVLNKYLESLEDSEKIAAGQPNWKRVIDPSMGDRTEESNTYLHSSRENDSLSAEVDEFVKILTKDITAQKSNAKLVNSPATLQHDVWLNPIKNQTIEKVKCNSSNDYKMPHKIEMLVILTHP